MNHLAKFFRVAGGISLLACLAAFFQPFLVIKQENYPTVKYSGFDYVKSIFGAADTGLALNTENTAIILCLIALPFILSLVMGIAGIAGSEKQVISGIGSIAVLALNAILYAGLQVLEPSKLNAAQVYEKGTGFWMLLGFSVAAAVSGIIGFITMPRMKKNAKPWTVPDDTQGQDDTSGQFPDADDGGVIHTDVPRGTMIGLSGDYKDASILFKPGETLKIGRDLSNDIVFPPEAKRVSRFHCAITWMPDKQKYEIMDKSSNGSFIEGREECLPQNIAIYLEPGTVIQVGGKENSFMLG